MRSVTLYNPDFFPTTKFPAIKKSKRAYQWQHLLDLASKNNKAIRIRFDDADNSRNMRASVISVAHRMSLDIQTTIRNHHGGNFLWIKIVGRKDKN
jgi:hypothetical protein